MLISGGRHEKGMRWNNRQFDEIDALRNTTASADMYRNCSFVVLSNRGHTISGLPDLRSSAETVERIGRLFRDGGIAALTPKASPGRPSKATPSFLDALSEAVCTMPKILARLCHLVHGTPGRPLGQANGHSFQQRPNPPLVASARIFGTAAQTHHERQACRSGLRKGQGPTAAD